MSLHPGLRVGPYEVVGPLGAGAMGEVFRAHDPRLKRDVALKVLAASAGSEAGRLRFAREAQVLAALNHPNIAQVFGVEQHGDTPVIVMELVEGPTLADRIARAPASPKPLGAGGMPIDDAVAVARQLCDGLEAAHERGIVHRDLKPANIKLLPNGIVKILDFGLARVLTDDTGADNAPTLAEARTDAGSVLGTAAYMSPEQARARTVDKRTDIWAFGCILYEMLVGAPIFSGESTTDILADVVRQEPDWTRLPATTPPRMRELLQRCLQKDPKERARDIGDVGLELGQALRQPTAPVPPVAAPAGSASASISRSLLWLAAGATLAAAIMLGAKALRTEPVRLAPVTRTVIAAPPDTTLALGRGAAIALSPDGRTLVFAARSKSSTLLYVRPLDRFESQPLAGTEDATNPFFSPDGRWVGFFAGEKLKKVSLDGGAPVTVADVRNPRGEVWGPDETIYVTASNNVALSRVSARGGKLELGTTLHEGELSHRWPTLLPDGKTLLFAVWNDAGWEPSRIVAAGPNRAQQVTVVEAGGGYPRYIRDSRQRGYLVYARSEGLLGAAFDENTLTLTGQPTPVVDGVLTNLSGGAHFDVSTTGTLAFVPGAFGEYERALVWVARDGKPLAPPRAMRALTQTWMLSPDATRVLRNNATGGGDIWIEDLASGRTTRVTSSPEQGNFNGVWSPDGKTVIFARGMGLVDFFRRPADGGGAEEQVSVSRRVAAPSHVSPDGRWLAWYTADPVTGSDIWITDLTSRTERAFVKTNANESNSEFSPDGKWLAYQSNDSGRFEVMVRSFPDGGEVHRVSTDGGTQPTWSSRTGELFYRGLDGRVMATTITAGANVVLGKPVALFDAKGYENLFAVSPDGQRLLMMPLIAAEQSASQIHLVQNFLTELRQRVK